MLWVEAESHSREEIELERNRVGKVKECCFGNTARGWEVLNAVNFNTGMK